MRCGRQVEGLVVGTKGSVLNMLHIMFVHHPRADVE